MKKFFSVIGLCLCSLFVFASCGVEGSNAVSGIKFVNKVFYVDKGVRTFLDYKIYPSTAQSYNVTYNVSDGIDDADTYVFSNGYFTIRDNINSQAYSPIRITISLNDFSDTCEVRLREYPTSVGFFNKDGTTKASDIVYGGATYVLGLSGEFLSGRRNVNNNEFTYKITSSDPSIIEVKDEQGLTVQSTGRRGSSEVKVEVCNSEGTTQTGLSATIRLNVVSSVNDVFATFGNSVIRDKNKLNLSLSGGEEFKIRARYFDSSNIEIDLADYEVFLSNDKFFTLEKNQGGYTLTAKAKDEVNSAGGTVDITIQTLDIGTDGNPVKIKITVQVQFLT